MMKEAEPLPSRPLYDCPATQAVMAYRKFRMGFTKRKRHVRPLVRFRRIARLALICCRLCQQSKDSVDASKAEYLSVIQVSQDYAQLDRGGLFFDPSDFKANKQIRMPQEARRILHDIPHKRAKRDIDYLRIVLRGIKAFAEYPKKMQRQLCQVGWFESYEPRRAIIRQGHHPHSFYFILNGTVIVTAFDKDNGGTKLLVSLHRGMSFGELAVISQSKRQATVSTQTATELLCISGEDFEEIFMAGGKKTVTDPDHNSFIKNIRFLKNWPVHLLAQNPNACMFHYFNRGQVLVRDSNQSEWIYIVKSGSLSVLKKLKEVLPQTEEEILLSNPNFKKKKDKKRKPYGTWQRRSHQKRQRSVTLSSRESGSESTKSWKEWESEPEVYKSQYEMERRLERSLPGLNNPSERLGVLNYDSIIDTHKARIAGSKRSGEDDDGFKLPPLPNEDVLSKDNYNKDEEKSEISSQRVRLPDIRKTSKGAYLSSGKPNRKISKKEHDQNIQKEIQKREQELWMKKATQEEGRKTIAEEFDNKPPTDYKLTEADLHPMFILVKVLERGQYFGVHSVIGTELQPTFSVVSNGAECIMISKKFFKEKSTDSVRRNLEECESRFPPDEALQRSLQSYVNWQADRKKMYLTVVNDKQKRKEKRRQYLPQYTGQYCFRTGPV
ncbi:uncharacterized protein LOC110448602 isoform X2 [Mizuhopecten yessoensis]|uniref:uncharacterized protein LOC110448602 isoform X2 n=1 Tax=Mizuhopecten yessoensis TaxID=6573 RepID=UPI000B45DDB4|nr:uncharacterized protein LOC110448602 isoform X2 [Mizuhopecten yessoensis]XP_021350616.1 uncharacterized protein LOC110448602 isoform X2 [Mizuhopecten yessoensis]